MFRIEAASAVAAVVLAAGGLSVSLPARADTLLIDRVEASRDVATPNRGQSMNAVEAAFGAPVRKLEPRGGQKSDWPVIHRWEYPRFTVYFERSHVIDVVMQKATPLETGPKPVE